MAEISNEQLKTFVERIETVEEQISSLKSDEKEIYAEAKSAGFDVKALKQIIRIRKLDPQKLEIEESVLETYRAALGL